MNLIRRHEQRPMGIAALVLLALGSACAWFALSGRSDAILLNAAAAASGLLIGGSALISGAVMPSQPGKRHWLVMLVRAFAAVSSLVGVACIVLAAREPGTEKSYELRIASGFFIGLGLGFFGVLYRPLLERLLARRSVYFGSLAALALAIGLLVCWCGMRQFGGFDHSVIIDYAWRLYIGQRPIADFPSTAPIGFVLGAYYGFLAFGPKWSSIIFAFACYAVLTFFWSIALLSQLTASRWSRVIYALALQAMCMVAVSYWWYNPLTTSVAVLFALSAYVWLQQPRLLAANLSYGASLILLASMKPNVGGIVIGITTAVFLTSKAHWARVVLISAAAFAIFALWLRLHGISLLDCVRGYLEVAGKAATVGPFFANPSGFEALVAVIMLGHVFSPLIFGAGAAFQRFKRDWRSIAIGAGCLLAGVLNYLAAGETKLADLVLVLFGALIASGIWQRHFAEEHPAVSRGFGFYFTILALTLSCAGIAVGMTRHRVRGIGPGLFFDYRTAPDRFPDGFFQGLQSSEKFQLIYAQTAQVVSEAATNRIYFGPRMQWAYAAFNIPSPVGQPVWWHPGFSFREEDQLKYADLFMNERRDVLVFFKDDMIFFPPELRSAIHDNYEEDPSFSTLTVFRHKGGALLPTTFADASSLKVKKVLTATVTIDVPTTASPGEFGTRVSLPGVQPTDHLILSPTQHFGTWGIYYNSLGTVTIAYSNTTGTDQDPPPIVFRVTALQF